MSVAQAQAKINLALVVGPVREDGLHEIATLYQRLALHDTISLQAGPALVVEGFAEDTLVRRALEAAAAAAGAEPHWHARIEKRIPVAAGLGGGSSDAAAALMLASESLGAGLPGAALPALARSLGADVPFFLERGPRLGTGDGTELEAVDVPQGFAVVILLPDGVAKRSTAEVYGRFDRPGGFEQRKAELLAAVAAGDLAALPPNDLVSSPLAGRMLELGAFRADVSGAGPAVYGLFSDREHAAAAAARLRSLGRVFVTEPAW